MKKELKKKKFNIGKKPFFIVILLIMFLLVGGTFAWYLVFGIKQQADTKDIPIMSPYFLYLLNPGKSESLQFSVGNIHPGEVKQVVICVSNKKPDDIIGEEIDIAKESDFKYDLEFIYTENLQLDYKVYELTKNDYNGSGTIPKGSILIENVNGCYWTKRSNGSSVTGLEGTNVREARWNSVFGNDGNDVQNKGQYWLYQTDAIGGPLHLTYQNGQYDYDYYLIEMSWKEDAKFSDNAKETDLLYVVVNAKQPEPQLN